MARISAESREINKVRLDGIIIDIFGDSRWDTITLDNIVKVSNQRKLKLIAPAKARGEEPTEAIGIKSLHFRGTINPEPTSLLLLGVRYSLHLWGTWILKAVNRSRLAG